MLLSNTIIQIVNMGIIIDIGLAKLAVAVAVAVAVAAVAVAVAVAVLYRRNSSKKLGG